MNKEKKFIWIEMSRGELKVAKLLCDGLTNKEIADNLFVTEKAIKQHITNIFKKTGHTNRSSFIAGFYKTGSYYKKTEENVQIDPNSLPVGVA